MAQGLRRQNDEGGQDYYFGDERLRNEGRNVRAQEIALEMMENCTRDGNKVSRHGNGNVDLGFTLTKMQLADAPVREADGEFQMLQELAECSDEYLALLAKGETPDLEKMVGDVQFLAKVLIAFKTLLNAETGDDSIRETMVATTTGARAAIEAVLQQYRAGVPQGEAVADVAEPLMADALLDDDGASGATTEATLGEAGQPAPSNDPITIEDLFGAIDASADPAAERGALRDRLMGRPE